MGYRVITGRTTNELVRQLDGQIISKFPLNATANAVGGLTLIFTQPAATTITFSGSRTAAQIVTDINAGAGLSGIASLVQIDGSTYLGLKHATLVTLSHTGTANAVFGFSTTSGDATLSGAPVAQAKIAGFNQNVSGAWCVLIAP